MAQSVLKTIGDMPLRVFIQDGTTGAAIAKTFGKGGVPDLNVLLNFGTGTDQASKAYIAQRPPLAATTFDNLDLAGGLVDGLGNTLTFATLKLALVAIVAPDYATKSLRVGPQGQSNPFLGAWGGTGATVYKAFNVWDLTVYSPTTGYTVTAGTGDIFPVYNPSAISVDYTILLVGT